jgi:hypothetical protein
MDVDEVRAKAAEISVNICAQMTAAYIIKHGADTLTEFEPLGFAKDLEFYISTGIIPKPIRVKHNPIEENRNE